MSLEHHPLLKEFPEHTETIHNLKTSNNHFKKLFDEYHDIDKKVYRFESGEESTSDTELESLKKQRLSLKDQLFNLIKQN